jgi:two-component system LytT family sensor kinase
LGCGLRKGTATFVVAIFSGFYYLMSSVLAPVAARVWPRRVLRDVLAWLPMLALLFLHPALTTSLLTWSVMGPILLGLLAWMIGVYGNHLVLVPRLFDQGRYRAYFGVLLGWVLVLHAAVRGLEWLLFPKEYLANMTLWYQPGLNLFGQMLLALPFLFMWRAVTQRRDAERNQLLAQEQQLRLLEAQVNPHFLFNTLNSLYALSLTQSPRTPDLLLALAELMRYQLESTRRPRVPLVEELDYLRSYAQLQEMRLGPRCPVQVALPTEAEAAGRTIAPLLLLALVENAFTHGTRRATGSFVHLRLALVGARLTLTLRNALPPPGAAQVGTGTGLPNSHQRLALLYPGRHHLHTAATNTEFQTDLVIDL